MASEAIEIITLEGKQTEAEVCYFPELRILVKNKDIEIHEKTIKGKKMKQIENTLTSMEVAEMVGKTHNMILRDIRNIIGHFNESNFALVDYFIKDTYKDSKGEVRPSYRLTKKGCELFSTRMTGAKGTQFAVAYIERFNQMEKFIKDELDFSNMSPELQIVGNLFKATAKLENRVNKVEETQENLKDILTLDSANWKEDCQNIIRKIAHKLGGGNAYQQVQSEIYSLVERRGGFNLNQRLRNMQTRQREEGYSKTATKKINKLNVIEQDKRLIEIYVAVVKEYAAKMEVVA